MAMNKEVGEKMEQAAKDAYQELLETLEDMTPKARDGAEVVISWFRNSYRQAGYKKLARKLVKGDINA